ncbi:MAG TPA: conjugal transfer protein TraJ [Nitrosospira sp.]|nr:conjugal transfer protein TraJ [Nitrosospira sp.]
MTRDRKRPIKVWVSPEERAEIKRLAASANLPLSAYLRTAGLNQQIRSILDVQAVTELSKVNGDLGRVAGLLKLWLAEKRGVGAPPFEVEKMMKEFRRLQTMSHKIMGEMTRGKND